MWFLVISIVIVVLILVALGAVYTYISPLLLTSEEAKTRIAKGTIQTVVDVRTGIEWNRGHYPTAVHVPTSEITKEKIEDLISNRVLKEPVLVYCNTG